MKKILLVHNDYGKYSGEEAVVDRMATMLADCGYDVAQLRMSTAASRETLLGKMHGFIAGLYSVNGVRAMRKALRKEKPDVVNIHNLYPFISPAALFECKKAGVPVVMTIHNFRLICPTGLFMRNGEPCEYCLSKGNEWGCVKYNCEHSLMKSIGYAARNAVARITGAYAKCVDRFACITEFQRQKLIAAGFDPEKIVVIPNAIDSPAERETFVGKYVAYSGRLSREKGVDMIVDVARRHPEIKFKFAGAVRDADIVADLPDNVTIAGYITGDELRAFYRDAAFFVMASRWYEGFPMSILEAAQYGKATVGPNHGGFTEIIGTGERAIGRLFMPCNVDDLERQTVALWSDRAEAERLGAAAYEKLKAVYSTDAVGRRWEDLLLSLV